MTITAGIDAFPLPNAPLSPIAGLLFIDPTVQDIQHLLTGLQPGITAILLDTSQDGVEQITTVLAGQSGITSLHILSHGFTGGVQLGNRLLNANTIGQYTSQLQTWQSALTDDADILFYGCNVGAADLGNTFLTSLATLTGADIAASTNLTGAASLGGNWDLESATGIIETPLAFNLETRAQYNHTLATVTVNNTSNISNGTVTSIAALIANDGGDGISLREAIQAANATPGEDIITFNLPAGAQTINSGGTLTDNVQILNTTGATNLTVTLGFTVESGVTAHFDQLTISTSSIGNAGIRNLGINTTISNSIISGNQGPGISNGPMGVGANLTISNTIISGNQGDGIFNIAPGTTIINSTISNNQGEGIFNRTTISAISNSTISDNQKNGIENFGSIRTISNSTISGNQDNGIFNIVTIDTISNSTISGNRNSGISNNSFFITGTITTINNVTIANNAQGILNNASVVTTLQNSILAGNTTGNLNGTAPITTNNNLLAANLVEVGLGDLAENGAAITRTHVLLPGSPAIDAAGIGATAADQRGITAVGTRDIGAFESRQFTIATTSGTPQSTAINTAFPTPLGIQVSSAFSEPVAGGIVTFAPPGTGASAVLSSLTANLDATGNASVTATANDIVGGAYTIDAGASGITNPLAFSLTNTPTPSLPTTPILPTGLTHLSDRGGVDGVYQVGGNPSEVITLQADWVIRDAAFNNEIGYFVADNAQGAINGIAPGDPAYARTALTSAGRRVLFRSGEGVGAGIDVTLTAGQFLVFYLVQDTTTENFLATNPSNSASGRQVLFSRSVVNPSQFDQVRDRTLAPGVLEIAWEDLGEGGDRDFNDVVIRIGPATFQVPGTTGTTPVRFDITQSDALFNNELGFFYVDDPTGRIGTLRPGDPGYTAVAFASSNFQVIIPSGQRQGASATPALQAGRFVGWYIIQNASTADFVLRNLANRLDSNPVAFFSFITANPDGVDHFRRVSANEFGVEDLAGGGDRDFNDLVFRVSA